MPNLTFRSSRIVYYGPHACENCGAMICKMGREFGGNAFTYPEGPIYPNTEWHPHVCDPKRIVATTEKSAIPVLNPVVHYGEGLKTACGITIADLRDFSIVMSNGVTCKACLAAAPPGVDLPAMTHLAVTVAGSATRFACGAWNTHQPSTSDRTLVTCPRCLAGQR